MDEPVVTVGEKILTKQELYDAIPDNISKEDSNILAQDFLNRWIRAELMLRKAELNLTPEEKDVSKLLEEYRRSLLVNQYQMKMLQQKYSPMITSNEIKQYYDKMIDNFVLNKNIVKGIFIIVPKNVAGVNDLRKWYKSDKSEDMVKMEAFCFHNAIRYDVFLEEWRPFDMINNKLPYPVRNPERFLKYHRHYEQSDSANYYLLNIKDYKLMKETAPLDYVENRIKAILLNKKRVDFINKLESDLYEEGLKQKIIKFY
ncbi:MAG: hypothetical protein GXO47_08105 [Chlorobi bacterium]|nr:hypothetical protein [Chlorobiota bacterium]